MTNATRVCVDCNADISHRHWNAKRCVPCYRRNTKIRKLDPADAERSCETCGTPFIAKRIDSRCCSPRCTRARLNAIHNAARQAQRVPRECPVCKASYLPMRSDSTTCSPRCGRRLHYRHAPVLHQKTCALCGKGFTSKRSDAKRCSRRCNSLHHYMINRDAIIAAAAEWSTANRQKRRLISLQYKAKRRGWEGDGPGISLRDWLRILNRHEHRCSYCGVRPDKLHMDHVVPLSRGGAHAIGNVLPACETCNLSKSAKLLVEWKRR
jgi:DNA polymerase III epsilon subunit-like protein